MAKLSNCAPPQSIIPTTHSPKPSLSNNHRPRLIFVSSVVAREPHPRKIPPPLSVPSNFQNRLKTSDLIFIARQLEYGQSLDYQKRMRRLLAPFVPSSCALAVHVPPHVLGGKTNWAAAIDSLLFFFSLSPKLQLEHTSSATIDRSRWYIKNIARLCDNRPAPLNVLRRCLSPSPLEEGSMCPFCGFLPTPHVMAHSTAQALVKRAPAGACLQCFGKREQSEKQAARNDAIRDLLTHQLDHPTNVVISERTHVIDTHRLIHQHFGASGKTFAARFPRHFSLLVIKIMPTTIHGESISNIKAGYLNTNAAWIHSNMFDINTLGSAHDALLLLLPSHDYVFLQKARFSQRHARKFASAESLRIKNGSTGHRGGAASGVSLMDARQVYRAFSVITQGPTTLIGPPTQSTSRITAVYASKDDTVKEASHGYRLMKMSRLSPAEKRREAEACASYSNILIGEGLTYLVALLCANEFIPVSDAESFNFGRLKLLLYANCQSPCEDIVLKWMTGTGEMRNHEAMACHKDCNNSHGDEILSLFHRHGKTKRNGLIYFPHLNFVLGLEGNKNTVVCLLKASLHVPDPSRNTHNFTKVHGPPAHSNIK